MPRSEECHVCGYSLEGLHRQAETGPECGALTSPAERRRLLERAARLRTLAVAIIVIYAGAVVLLAILARSDRAAASDSVLLPAYLVVIGSSPISASVAVLCLNLHRSFSDRVLFATVAGVAAAPACVIFGLLVAVTLEVFR